MIDVPRYVLTTLPDAPSIRTEVLVVGAGAAGLMAALAAARHAEVLVLARTSLPESNSARAQGGIAAALDAADSPVAHGADTLTAGAGLSDVEAVNVLVQAAPALMRTLTDLGVPFTRLDDGRLALGLEGGHSARRIVHVGDATGLALVTTLLTLARAHPRITLLEGWHAVDLLDDGERIIGVLARNPSGAWQRLIASATIIAGGGAGALYSLTSNHPIAIGEGIAMAFRAGAEVADMEFVQFHPTVYRTRDGQGFLITEAARGEGGILRTPAGERFMPAYDPRGELAPRDVVTRGIYAAMRRTGCDYVLLDLTRLPRATLEQRFPTICARLRADGLDPATTPIPVAPAAHYLMGGIRTDLNGAASLAGLYAVGEAACTGVHGANRLASNSLLECLVFGERAGEAAARTRLRISSPRSSSPSLLRTTAASPPPSWRTALATLMDAAAGPIREKDGLRAGLAALADWSLQAPPDDPEGITAANAVLTARLIVNGALLREESRGSHFRTDFPVPRSCWQVHLVQQRNRMPFRVKTIAAPPMRAYAAD